MIQYVYIQSEPNLWTVGFYDPKGNWISESDHNSKEAAAKHVSILNGLPRRAYLYKFYNYVMCEGSGMIREDDLVGFLEKEES